MVKKTTAKKIVKKRVVKEVIEEVKLPKRYYVQFWKRIRPSDDRFDEKAGTIYWSDVKQDICIESLNDKWSSDVEVLILKNDLSLSHGVNVSYAETPKEWVRNAHLAELGYNFYATQYMEIIDETE